MTNNVETEKIHYTENKKRSTKITAIIVLGIVFALALFIVISSVATVGLNPRFVAKPDVVYVYKANATNSSGILTSDNEKYDDFMEYYDQMFTTSFLSALFNGRLSGYTISAPMSAKSETEIISGFENAYVRFKYDEAIALTYSDGREYQKETNTSKKITFKDMYFQIKEEDKLQTLEMYVIDFESTQTKGKTQYVKVSVMANTSEMLKNIKQFHNSIKA